MTATRAGTKARIVRAALETLKQDGFAGASARAIARRGGFNQALVFYHFGSVRDLLMAALDHTSGGRMEAYRAAVEGIDSVPQLINVALDMYREDLASGHITVLSEMIAGGLTNPELAAKIVARVDPWIDFTEETIAAAIDGSPLEGLMPPRELAFAVVAFYLGIDLLTHLDSQGRTPESLFQRFALIVSGYTETVPPNPKSLETR